MSETTEMIPIGDTALEARFAAGPRGGLLVIAHPHPTYGGSLDNNVVRTLRDAARSVGMATCRFNFRGVGRSGGRLDADAPDADLDALLRHPRVAGLADAGLHLAGYSYGAWVTLRALTHRDAAAAVKPASVILVSPPLEFLPFEDLALPAAPTLITLGAQDTFCSEAALRAWIAARGAGPALEILGETDHFYTGREHELAELTTGFLESPPD